MDTESWGEFNHNPYDIFFVVDPPETMPPKLVNPSEGGKVLEYSLYPSLVCVDSRASMDSNSFNNYTESSPSVYSVLLSFPS